MRIDILTVVPELLESPLSHSIVGRAVKKGLAEIHIHNIRKYGIGPRLTVDDYSYGGDAGMVMMVEPVYKMIEELKAEREYDEIIYMSPDGELLNQGIANELSLKGNLILLCGHYKGIDHRIREHLVTREISVGDYVVSGGEIPAALLADAIIRLIPGALTDETSALSDSFQDDLLSPPIYTRPAEFNGWKVPDVLLSGNPKLIRAWQDEQALERTKRLRPLNHRNNRAVDNFIRKNLQIVLQSLNFASAIKTLHDNTSGPPARDIYLTNNNLPTGNTLLTNRKSPLRSGLYCICGIPPCPRTGN